MVDSSLEHDLLHVVGYAGTPKKGSQKSGRGRTQAPSDDSSSDEDADYKSEEEEDEDDGYRGRSRGRSRGGKGASQMPLKKRFETDNDVDDGEHGQDGSDDGYGSELSFGSDLYKDEDDRERLQQMNELDREKILFERGERRENFLQRKQRRREMRAKQVAERSGSQALSSRRASSAGKFGTRSRQDDALGELKAKAEAKAAKQQRQQNLDNMARKRRDKEAASRGRREDSPRPQQSSSSASESAYEGSDVEDGHDGDHSDDDQRRKAETDADIDDLQTILLRRSKLAKWCCEPFFADVVVGCLVRIGIGANCENQPVYRICEVVAVDGKDASKQYTFEGRVITKYLDCKWGEHRARWQMMRVSDKEPLRREFEEWLHELERSNCKRLSKAEVADKRESLQRSHTFVYTAADVKKTVEEKRMAAARPRNIALEKDRLSKEISLADERGDKAAVEKLTSEVMDLEAYTRRQETSRTDRELLLSGMNKKNRAENFRIASASVSHKDTKAGDAGHDPFSRRWTRSQNYYRTPNADKQTGEEALAAKAHKEAALEKAKQEGQAAEVVARLENDVAAIGNQLIGAEAPVDHTTSQMSRHMFQMALSLQPLEHWGSFQEAYMARKRAQEASCGALPGIAGSRRPGTTLTVNDYKRRRGLL